MTKPHSRIQSEFNAIGRELLDSELPAVDAFHAKYGTRTSPQSVDVSQASLEENMNSLPLNDKGGFQPKPHRITVTQSLADFKDFPFLPLSAFVEALPDRAWKPEPPVTLYLRDIERVMVQVETSTTPLAAHLWRDEELGKQGIHAHEEDAKAFADGLVATLAPRLSLFDLEYVVKAFSAELERAEAERQAAIAEHAARHPKL